VIAWLPPGRGSGEVAVVVSNFTPVPREGYRIGVPYPGFYKEVVNTDAGRLWRLEHRQPGRRDGGELRGARALALPVADASAARDAHPRAGGLRVPKPVLDLSGQVAVVTGASSGIGQGVAIALAEAGAKVVVNYRGEKEGAETTARAVREAGSEALVVHATSRRGRGRGHVPADEGALRDLQILVANAGLQRDAPAHEMTLDDWRKVIDVNLTGQFLCCRAAIREYLARGVSPRSAAPLARSSACRPCTSASCGPGT
jgi:hypothetical protein